MTEDERPASELAMTSVDAMPGPQGITRFVLTGASANALLP